MCQECSASFSCREASMIRGWRMSRFAVSTSTMKSIWRWRRSSLMDEAYGPAGGIVRDGAAQVGAIEGGAAEVGGAQVGAREIRVLQVGVGEVGEAQVGV